MSDEQEPLFLIPGQQAYLDDRGAQRAVSVLLERYRAIVGHTDHHLTEPELNLVCDTMNGVAAGLGTPADVYVGLVKLNVLDALDQEGAELAEKWGLDEAAIANLRHKLKSLSIAEEMALLEAVEDFWRRARPL